MKPANVDQYIALQPEDLQPMLEQIRGIIRQVAPQAEEKISYMVPCYKLHSMFVGFGVHKGGCSLYAMNTGILSQFGDELQEKGISVSGSTIHFDAKKKLPAAFIKKLVKARMKMDEERFKSKSSKK